MKPTLRQYLSLCKAERFLRDNINKDEEHYEPAKVQLLLGNIKEVSHKIAKSLKDENYNFSLEMCFSTLDMTMKAFKQKQQEIPKFQTDNFQFYQQQKNLLDQVDQAHDTLANLKNLHNKYLYPDYVVQPQKKTERYTQKRRKQLDQKYQQRLKRLYQLTAPKQYVKKQISTSRIQAAYKKSDKDYFSKYKELKNNIAVSSNKIIPK